MRLCGANKANGGLKKKRIRIFSYLPPPQREKLAARWGQPTFFLKPVSCFQCFYIPKCRMGRAELQQEVEEVKSSLDAQLVATSSCLADHSRHPRDAILNRKYTRGEAALALLWPGLLLGGGALLVVLVKLTQHLARLSAEACSEAPAAGGGRREAKHYRPLGGSSTPPPP